MAKKQTTPKKKPVFRITKQIRDAVVTELSGEDTIKVVDYLKGKENISEFVIAQDLEEEINVIRNKLYRLLKPNLISFNRKKDKQKGWYIYYWTLKLHNVKFLHFDLKRKRLVALNERLKREQSNHFFICTDRCIRLDFEQAISFDYRCPECGELLFQEDNTETIGKIQKEITKLEKDVEALKKTM
jgi:transcription initiation factor TFIIE subunit alpha